MYKLVAMQNCAMIAMKQELALLLFIVDES
jgi:hypothetical protein